MIEVMKDTLKSKFPTEVEAAWNKTIDILFLKIFEGMERTASWQAPINDLLISVRVAIAIYVYVIGGFAARFGSVPVLSSSPSHFLPFVFAFSPSL